VGTRTHELRVRPVPVVLFLLSASEGVTTSSLKLIASVPINPHAPLIETERQVIGPIGLLVFASAVAFPAVSQAAPFEASPPSLSFGQVNVGKSSLGQSVSLFNRGAETITVERLSVVGADPADFSLSADSCSGAVLAQNEGCEVSATFSPQAGGAREVTLQLLAVGEVVEASVPLSGEGVLKQLKVPATASFPPTTVANASTIQIPVENESEAGVSITKFSIEGGANPGDFSIEGDNCAGFLSPTQSCEVSVRFSPSGAGAEGAQLHAISDGTPGDQTVELSGEGVAAELAFEPGKSPTGVNSRRKVD
jgi:hypothetical protein